MNIFGGVERLWRKKTGVLNVKSQSGQAGIILVLITVVLVTISLSVASRTVTDISLSEQEEETTRAFDAAEAGIEEALRQDITTITSGSFDVGGIQADYTITESEIEFILEELETVEIDVSGFSNDIIIEWGTDGEACNAANPSLADDSFASIVVTTIAAGPVSTRLPYSGIGCDRRSGGPPDGFDRASPNPSSTTTTTDTNEYLWKVVQSTSSIDTIRIRAVYADTYVLITAASGSLPVQSWTIHSEAQAPGGETRAVEVTQKAPAPPSIFDFVIFSGAGSLIKP